MVVAALAHIYPDLDRVIQEHATDEGKAMLQRIEKMTTAHAVLRLVGKDMGDLVDRPLEQILRHARGAARLRRASSWAPRCRRRRC